MPKREHVTECLRCHRTRIVEARDLCRPCYTTVLRDGTVDDWPRRTRTGENMIESVERLQAQGLSWAQVAGRLGYSSRASAHTSYRRAKARHEVVTS